MELKNLIIREMGIEDLNEVFDIESSSSPHPWSKKMFLDEIKSPFSYCFTIQRDGVPECRVMGFICFRNLGEESELLNICVHPQYRGIGIGKKLMQFYIDFSQEMKIKTFYLEVNVSNQPAIQLYQFFYYQSSGKRKQFYQNQFDALLMIRKA
jgi:ribosomal-protein-alanine N-acetyltransferase